MITKNCAFYYWQRYIFYKIYRKRQSLNPTFCKEKHNLFSNKSRIKSEQNSNEVP